LLFRIIHENQRLIEELKELREQLATLRAVQKQSELKVGLHSRAFTSRVEDHGDASILEAKKIIDLQRKQIEDLRLQIDNAHAQRVMKRPVSKEKLPPLDSFAS